MRLLREGGSLGFVAIILLVACSDSAVATPTPEPTPRVGGTLRIGVTGDPSAVREFALFDPAFPTQAVLGRCCTVRTLLAYPGRSTLDGGTVLAPDLAADWPTVSRDGSTWTFRLRQGVRYAPPYQDAEIVAGDFVRALERAARLSPEVTEPGAPLDHVSGAAAYAAGEAATIAGLETPDAHTLVIRLTEPYGGIGTQLADVAWAPIPERAVEEHDADLAAWWPSSGPYMFEALPADAAGNRVVLVRNPSWDRATDPIRGAWVDRIEVAPAGEVGAAFQRLEAGEFDLLDRPAPRAVVDRFQADPLLSGRLAVTASETIFWLPMNLAAPPFDDVAVRRAVTFVLDRASLRDAILTAREESRGPQPPGVLLGHVFPDSLTAGLLIGYEPFASASGHGDIDLARREMARSRYDQDRDGRCDYDACRAIRLPAEDQLVGRMVADQLTQIGLDVVLAPLEDGTDMRFPANRTAVQANVFGWGYSLSGSDLASLLRGRPEDEVDAQTEWLDVSLVGATSAQLSAWGYAVTEVPTLDDRIDACDLAIGYRRARCWAQLDQLVTEVVVPWVPLFSFQLAHVSGPAVDGFSLDQSLIGAFPATDRVSLAPADP